MKLFAISDLHFALSVDKPMDVFGSRWADHVERIIAHWHRDISDEDTVLIGGDISWGNSLEEAESDLGLLNTLPGEKILCAAITITGGQQLERWSNSVARRAFSRYVFAKQCAFCRRFPCVRCAGMGLASG